MAEEEPCGATVGHKEGMYGTVPRVQAFLHLGSSGLPWSAGCTLLLLPGPHLAFPARAWCPCCASSLPTSMGSCSCRASWTRCTHSHEPRTRSASRCPASAGGAPPGGSSSQCSGRAASRSAGTSTCPPSDFTRSDTGLLVSTCPHSGFTRPVTAPLTQTLQGATVCTRRKGPGKTVCLHVQCLSCHAHRALRAGGLARASSTCLSPCPLRSLVPGCPGHCTGAHLRVPLVWIFPGHGGCHPRPGGCSCACASAWSRLLCLVAYRAVEWWSTAAGWRPHSRTGKQGVASAGLAVRGHLGQAGAGQCLPVLLLPGSTSPNRHSACVACL